jgi:hypothetical protein
MSRAAYLRLVVLIVASVALGDRPIVAQVYTSNEPGLVPQIAPLDREAATHLSSGFSSFSPDLSTGI